MTSTCPCQVVSTLAPPSHRSIQLFTSDSLSSRLFEENLASDEGSRPPTCRGRACAEVSGETGEGGVQIRLSQPAGSTSVNVCEEPRLINQLLICSKYLIVAYKFGRGHSAGLFGGLRGPPAKHRRWISSLNPNSLRGEQLR